MPRLMDDERLAQAGGAKYRSSGGQDRTNGQEAPTLSIGASCFTEPNHDTLRRMLRLVPISENPKTPGFPRRPVILLHVRSPAHRGSVAGGLRSPLLAPNGIDYVRVLLGDCGLARSLVIHGTLSRNIQHSDDSVSRNFS
jgi:hypothetical protein